jgi:putative CocE/NonD family hydrolase
VIGTWTHADLGLLAYSMREGIEWFRSQLNGGAGRPGGVRLHIGGVDEWRELPDWPPHERTTPWYLRPAGELGRQAPVDSGPDRFRYDPADPTPSPGGALLTKEAGRRDNRPVEARRDVLVYTSAPLATGVEAVGPVSAVIHVRGSGEFFDVFVRVCDVDPAGPSENISDGLVRVSPGLFPPDADGVREVEVDLWPMGYVFRTGHRIRIQLAGAAHPRYARNTGTGEPLGTAIAVKPVDLEIFHDPAHPSQLRLPV